MAVRQDTYSGIWMTKVFAVVPTSNNHLSPGIAVATIVIATATINIQTKWIRTTLCFFCLELKGRSV
ncbi:MAG: hypothetical protein ABR909_05165 [Candidatus Bathyarchaeia archaeon]